MPDPNNPNPTQDTPVASLPPAEAPPAPPAEMPPMDDSNGSSAPPFDIPPIVAPPAPKKKFGGGKTILTLLGILVLVGGLGAGVVLVRQRQLFSQKAATPTCNPAAKNTCSTGTPTCVNGIWTCPYCSRTNQNDCAFGCTPTVDGGTCNPATSTPPPTCNPAAKNTCSTGTPTCVNGIWTCPTAPAPNQPAPNQPTPGGAADGACLGPGQSCSSGNSYTDHACAPTDLRCGTAPGGSGIADGSCLTPTGTCSSGKNYFDTSCAVTETRCGTKPSGGGTGGGGGKNYCTSTSCDAGADYNVDNTKGCVVYKYKCNDVKASGVGCQDIFVSAGKSASFTESCGTEQIDVACFKTTDKGSTPTQFISKRYPSACGGGTAGPTAQCLNVKAYDTAWTQLSADQLKALKAGDKVRFTVTGSATAGVFDKAKFKINGAETPEITAKKPGTEEFFDEFTIPAGVTTFTINAQIHHATLGWSN